MASIDELDFLDLDDEDAEVEAAGVGSELALEQLQAFFKRAVAQDSDWTLKQSAAHLRARAARKGSRSMSVRMRIVVEPRICLPKT